MHLVAGKYQISSLFQPYGSRHFTTMCLRVDLSFNFNFCTRADEQEELREK